MTNSHVRPILSLLSPFAVIGLVWALARPPRHLEDIRWIFIVGVCAALFFGALGVWCAWRSRSPLGRALNLLGVLLNLLLAAWGLWAVLT